MQPPISRRDAEIRKGPGRVRAQGPGKFVRNEKMTCVFFLSFQPPKKSYVNYKVLQEQIKEKKAAKEEEKRTVGVTAFSLLN